VVQLLTKQTFKIKKTLMRIFSKRQLNIFDGILKIVILVLISLSSFILPLYKITYVGVDERLDEDYKIVYQYNYFGYLVHNETTEPNFTDIPGFDENRVWNSIPNFLFFILFGFCPLLLIVNILKFPKFNIKWLVILGLLSFGLFIITLNFYRYYNTLRNREDYIRKVYTGNENSSFYYGDEVNISFSNEFPYLIIIYSFCIILGSIVYDKFIEKYKMRIPKDSFFISFIKKVVDKKEETIFWDFKQTLSMWHVKNGEKRKNQQIKFCNIFASFANSNGGLIIIGISDDRKFVEIQDLENKIQHLVSSIRKGTNFPREYYRIRELNFNYNEQLCKCLLLIIAQSDRPIYVQQRDGDSYKFPFRIGTGLDYMNYEEIIKIKRDVSNFNLNFISDLKKV